MKMKGFNFWILLMGFVFLMAGTVLAETPPPKNLIKIATIAPKGSFMTTQIDAMDAEIRRETNNEVGIKLYYGSVQGDEKEVLSKIRLGQLHGGTFTGSGLGRIVPEVRVTELPYVFLNYDEVEYVRRQLRDDMNRRFAEKGFIVLGWNEIGFVYTFSKVPIISLEVARSQKWWQWEGDPLSKAMFDAFGITPVPLSFTDVMTSLSTRLIDTASITPYGAVAFHWFDRFEYMSEYPVTNVQGATIISKKVWDKISPESQKKILTICQPYFDRLSQKGREQDRQSVEVLKKAGIKVVTFDPKSGTLEFVIETSKKARASLVGKLYSKELLDKTMSILDDYRKAHPEGAVEKIR
jgi:TRAP-type C4-dicarboxylate transport system substrate-binding protein